MTAVVIIIYVPKISVSDRPVDQGRLPVTIMHVGRRECQCHAHGPSRVAISASSTLLFFGFSVAKFNESSPFLKHTSSILLLFGKVF